MLLFLFLLVLLKLNSMKDLINKFKKELYTLEAYIQQMPTDYSRDVEEARQSVIASIFGLDLLLEEVEGYKFRRTNIKVISDIETKNRPSIVQPLDKAVKGSDLEKIAYVRNLAIALSKRYFKELTVQVSIKPNLSNGQAFAQNLVFLNSSELIKAASRIDEILQKIKTHDC